nr:ribonuclease H-like domain, reverse transcriptase, RNA-dependent DNA polymerase [Tanacetum cinerariifolium]
MKAIRQVLCYVKGTEDYGITYKHNEGNKTHGFSNSRYGVNSQEGKRTTSIIFYYGESPISWSTQKQATVTLSSCESEFIAATQALWYVWESKDDGASIISKNIYNEPLGRGTEIKLHLREETGEYLEESKLKKLVTSPFISCRASKLMLKYLLMKMAPPVRMKIAFRATDGEEKEDKASDKEEDEEKLKNK